MARYNAFDNILRRRNSMPPSATKLGGEQRLIGALDDAAAAELGMHGRIANLAKSQIDSNIAPIGSAVRQLQNQPPLEISRESMPVHYYEPSDDVLRQVQADRQARREAATDGVGFADYNRKSLEWRENPTSPDQGDMVMLRKEFGDRQSPDVVKSLEATTIKYAVDPATGQEIPVTYRAKAKNERGEVTEWETVPMSQSLFNTISKNKAVPLHERKVLRDLDPAEKAAYDDAIFMGDDTSGFFRSLDFGMPELSPDDFLTVDASLREADAIARSGLARGTENTAEINQISLDALPYEGSPNYPALGQRSILVSDQGRINDQYRQELGERIPKSPHLQNKRTLMPASDRLESAAQWKTQPQPQEVIQLESGGRQFNPAHLKGFTTPKAAPVNAPGESVTPVSSLEYVPGMFAQHRQPPATWDATPEFITPEVLQADKNYQENLKYDHLFDNIADEVHGNALRNRQVQVIPVESLPPEVQRSAIPGVYVPTVDRSLVGDDNFDARSVAKQSLQPYAPKLNDTQDDYDWDAFDFDTSLAHIELDNEYYPITQEATVNFAGKHVYNNPADKLYSQPDILTAITSKTRELNRIEAQLQSLKSSPTAMSAIDADKQTQLYQQLTSRSQGLRSGIDTATSAYNKLVGVEPLPEIVAVTANPLSQSQLPTAPDAEIQGLYAAGVANQRHQRQVQALDNKWQQIKQIVNPRYETVDDIQSEAVDKLLQHRQLLGGTNQPMTAADAAYESFVGQRKWSIPQPPAQGIERTFGRLRAAVRQSRAVAPAESRFAPDPFATPELSSTVNYPTPQNSTTPMLALPPARSAAEAAYQQWQPQPEIAAIAVPSTPVAPARSAAAAAYRQWQPQADAPVPSAEKSVASPPSWAVPAAVAGSMGLVGLGGATLYAQRQAQQQQEREAEMKRSMGYRG